MKYLDEFEKDILQSVEANEWKSKNNTKERLRELQSYIKNEKKKEGYKPEEIVILEVIRR